MAAHPNSRALAARRWDYVQDYADAKSAVIEEIISRARAGLEPEATSGQLPGSD